MEIDFDKMLADVKLAERKLAAFDKIAHGIDVTHRSIIPDGAFPVETNVMDVGDERAESETDPVATLLRLVESQ